MSSVPARCSWSTTSAAAARPIAASDELDKELFRHQLEIRTDPTRDVDACVDAARGRTADGR